MRKIICLFVLASVALFTIPVFAAEPTVHHIVLFDLKDDVTPEQIQQMKTVGEALLKAIPGVRSVSIGKKARENRDEHVKDYDIALYVEWENNDTGDIYSPHVLHQSFLKLYKPLVNSIKVIDFYGE